jgi:hypothetical protein
MQRTLNNNNNMTMQKLNIQRVAPFVCLLAVLLFAACNSNNGGGMMKPAASGRPYEVLVVIPENLWEEPAGRAIYDVLATDIPGLPQPENSFHISHVDPKGFNNILNIFRNIVVVDIDKTIYSQTKYKYVRDEYATNQMIMVISSPSAEEFISFVERNRSAILRFFNSAEMNRQIAQLRQKYSKSVGELASDMFDCTFYAPDEINHYKRGEDFFWASSATATALVNICMYAYPYEGPQAFERNRMIAKRDSFMKANIPGETPDMYMATDTQTVTVEPITVQKQYACEMRGLWEMENDCMGGPFVSHSRVDTINNRVVVVEGFVYAPEKMKRGLIRRLEAALYSLELPKKKAENKK